MVYGPTRITETKSSTLDLFLTNNDTLVNQVRVIPWISDHEAVFTESSLRLLKKTPHLVEYKNINGQTTMGWGRNFENLAQAPELDIQTIWTSFKITIHKLMEKYIPHKTVRGDKKPRPWITRTIQALHRKRNKLCKRQRATRRFKDNEYYKKMM